MVDVVLENGKFVGVLRCSGCIVWRGEPLATKRAALAEAQEHRMQLRANQDDRDSQRFTMDLAAGLAEESRGDDEVLSL